MITFFAFFLGLLLRFSFFPFLVSPFVFWFEKKTSSHPTGALSTASPSLGAPRKLLLIRLLLVFKNSATRPAAFFTLSCISPPNNSDLPVATVNVTTHV